MTFEPRFEPLVFGELPPEEMEARSAAFHAGMKRRRTIRDFSPRPVPVEMIRNTALAAGTAPSGANLQPWHFVVVSDPAAKREVREAAEAAEQAFYQGRASSECTCKMARNPPTLLVPFSNGPRLNTSWAVLTCTHRYSARPGAPLHAASTASLSAIGCPAIGSRGWRDLVSLGTNRSGCCARKSLRSHLKASSASSRVSNALWLAPEKPLICAKHSGQDS